MTRFGALFDLDGVLIDTEGKYTEFWDEISRIYPTGIDNYALHIKGTTLEEIMKDFPDPEVRADILRRIREFQDTMTYPLFPGVERFLTDLAANGIPAAIVTSSDNRKMNFLFKEHPSFRNYFEVVIDSSKVTLSKPDPQGYLLAAEALGCDSKNYQLSQFGLIPGADSQHRLLSDDCWVSTRKRIELPRNRCAWRDSSEDVLWHGH